jgi:hypothetical protein
MESVQDASLTFKNLNNRRRINGNVLNFNQAHAETKSERAAAKVTGIPRSTAQYHARRQRECDLDDAVLAFFQSDAGMTFLNQLVLAIEFVLSQLGHCGLRLIQQLYELSQLDRLVACSVGVLSQRIKLIETNLIAYSEQQESQLTEAMPNNKTITCCLDETFPSGICLVAMEPVSNFILLEEMAPKRDTATWAKAMVNRLANLPVTVIQVTSDEAKALIKYTEQNLGAHHSPDLFHVQQEVSKASAAPLRAKIKKAQSAADRAEIDIVIQKNQRTAYEDQEKKPVGRPVDYIEREAQAEVEYQFAVEELKEAESRGDKVREANKALSEAYHPFDVDTGKQRTHTRLRRELNDNFDAIEATFKDADLSENSMKRVEKARRMIDSMVDTLQFFWVAVRSQVKLLELDKELEKIVMSVLLPAVYLELHSKKAQTADLRKQRLESSAKLYEQLEKEVDWKSLAGERKKELIKVATQYAQIFQRSSSNVEGRNGQLSLHHHIYKNMNTRKLSAATVIHNYFIRRQDGTTAAERFFGKAPEPLFKHLLSVTDYPAAPAKKRSSVRKLIA